MLIRKTLDPALVKGLTTVPGGYGGWISPIFLTAEIRGRLAPGYRVAVIKTTTARTAAKRTTKARAKKATKKAAKKAAR